MTKASKGLLDYLSTATAHFPEETVSVPEWGRDVTLRGFSSRERDAFEEDNLRRANAKARALNGSGKKPAAMQADLTNFRARLVARSIVEDGMRTCANPQAEELLGSQPASVIDPLFAVAQRLSGFTAADVEELAGNFEATAGEGSSSDSPDTSAGPSPN